MRASSISEGMTLEKYLVFNSNAQHGVALRQRKILISHQIKEENHEYTSTKNRLF